MKKKFILLTLLVGFCFTLSAQNYRNRYSMKLTPTENGNYKLTSETDIRSLVNNLDSLPDLYTPYNVPYFRINDTDIKTLRYTYTTENGTPLELEVDLPVKGKNHPFIVFIHGGGWNAGSMMSFRNPSQYMASQGIAGVRVSYTLVPQGGTYPMVMEQIKQALAFLKKNNSELNLNLELFGFCGSSAGAVLSGLAAMTIPGCKVLIGQDGAYDMVNTRERNFPSPTLKKKFFGSDDLQEMKKVSAIYNIPANPPATLLMHGSADVVISCRESEKLADILKKKNAIVECVIYKNYEHACTGYADIYQDVVKKMTEFASLYLK